MSSANKEFLKNTFAGVVQDYEYSRPGYPLKLKRDICSFANLEEDARLLEVGAGTGQATNLFLDVAAKLDLIEVSDEQVDFLKRKYESHPQVEVHKAYFEEFALKEKYDLIYSATAFHWIESDVGYPKAYEMLKEGGTLAVFWHMSSVTCYEGGVFEGLNEIKKKYFHEEALGYDEGGIHQVVTKRVTQIQTGGYFGEPKIREYWWVDTYDAERYTALVNTYSSTQSLPKKVRRQYLQEIEDHIKENGGKVELPQLVILYLVRKGGR
ncbi:MAG: methyltransferase domain-containing protein [Lachnospiraceae bacterium]|nr:methyltransferase domain-containing protein [Lachnospiraceae bacterium]